MKESILLKITKNKNRTALFHFTRMRNLPSIAHSDALFSCHAVDPELSAERRTSSREIQFRGKAFTANAHLRIADQVMDPGTTQQQFRQYLDKHVFFWPTRSDCLKMLTTYSRREPQEAFAILQLDAYSLIRDFYDSVKLTKYDSGSSPRYPNRCSYRKSLRMFLGIDQFEAIREHDMPSKPSDIREVLVEDRVTDLTHYLQAIYCNAIPDIPERWQRYRRPLDNF
ncbi:hypothetical protein [Paenibacillus sp. HB172176]|uniref:DUF7002 family protein n=1 Tax=Paenibacillus sp. HB172176 TaxID=2493690 RepID=UPI00143B7943|nr:hypothetical protein [Paenibacillus sp. HB172176]